MPLTQTIVADHLDMSQQQVGKLLSRLGGDLATAGLDEIRRLYIRSLRAAASGRGGADLATERLLLTAARRRKAEVDLRARCGELVNAEEVRRALVGISAGMRAALEKLPDVLAPRLAVEADENAIVALMSGEIEQVLRDFAAALRAGKFLQENSTDAAA